MLSNGPGRALGQDQPREAPIFNGGGRTIRIKAAAVTQRRKRVLVKPWEETVFLDVAYRLATDRPVPGICLLRKIVRVSRRLNGAGGHNANQRTMGQSVESVAEGESETLESWGWWHG